jgi:hypothetical protein
LDEIGLTFYEKMSFKVKVYGWTDADHKSSPCHFVTCELKIPKPTFSHLFTSLALFNDITQINQKLGNGGQILITFHLFLQCPTLFLLPEMYMKKLLISFVYKPIIGKGFF